MTDLIDLDEVRLIKSDPDAYSGEWNDDYERGFKDAINKVLSIQPFDSWIYCKDKLPELDKDVLVFAIRKDGLGDPVKTITRYIDYIWFGHRIACEPYWKDPWQYFHTDYEIICWQSLPDNPIVR